MPTYIGFPIDDGNLGCRMEALSGGGFYRHADYYAPSVTFPNGLQADQMEGVDLHYLDKGCVVVGFRLAEPEYEKKTAAEFLGECAAYMARVTGFFRKLGLSEIEVAYVESESFRQSVDEPLAVYWSTH